MIKIRKGSFGKGRKRKRNQDRQMSKGRKKKREKLVADSFAASSVCVEKGEKLGQKEMPFLGGGWGWRMGKISLGRLDAERERERKR